MQWQEPDVSVRVLLFGTTPPSEDIQPYREVHGLVPMISFSFLIHSRNVWITQGVFGACVSASSWQQGAGRAVVRGKGMWRSHCSWRSEEKAGAGAISEPVPVVALKKCVHILYLGRSHAFILTEVYCTDINICNLPLISAVMMHFYYIRVTWNCVLISWIPFSQLALEV